MTNQFGKILKTLRTNKNLTQKELGEKLNLSKSQITNYETVGFEPSLDTVRQLARFFNVSTDLLLGHSTGTHDETIKETLMEVQNTYYSLNEEQRKSFAKQLRAIAKFLSENQEFL